MTWLPRGEDFWSTACGRFDLLYSPLGYFVVIDWDYGVSKRCYQRFTATIWIQNRPPVPES